MFDNRLKELREKQGLSMSKVASDLGIPVQTYSNYEKDLREPTAMVLIRIANYFNASLDYLLDNTDHKKIILLPHSEQEDKLLSGSSIQKLRKGEVLGAEGLGMLCKLLECQPEDIIYYSPE